MLRPTDEDARKIEKLTRINQALIQRMERMDEVRGSSYALTRTAAMLEREVMERNADLERALAELSASNAKLAAARRTADEANRAKSRFLRAASHDLLQPLSAAKLLLAHLVEITADPMQVDLGVRITGCFDSAEELIRALLDIARLDSQAFEANPGPVAISRLFQRLGADLQPLAAQRGIELRFVMSSETVLSDPMLLRQIAQNLIINALKYSDGPKVLVGLRHAGEGGWLVVQDCGPGIDAARPGAHLQRVRAAVALGPAGKRARAVDRAPRLPAARAPGRADERGRRGLVLPGAAAADAQRLPAAGRPPRRRRRARPGGAGRAARARRRERPGDAAGLRAPAERLGHGGVGRGQRRGGAAGGARAPTGGSTCC